MRRHWIVALVGLAVTGMLFGCSDDSGAVEQDAGVDARPPRPDAYVGPCQDEPVPVFEGDYQLVVSSLQIGDYDEGFDLDWDGDADNVLASFGSAVNGPLRDSFSSGDIWIPMEFFGVEDLANDDCLNIGVYFGYYPPDEDEDGERSAGVPGWGERDCNDRDPNIHPGAEEVPGDRVDNDCDGLADETSDATPSDDATDLDGDGYSLADGDCDDRAPDAWPDAPPEWDPATIHPGAQEVCGDGLDNDCDGLADEDCNPYALPEDMAALSTVELDGSSLVEDRSRAVIVFRSGRMEDRMLRAGPAAFRFTVDVDGRLADLRIEPAMMEAQVSAHLPTSGMVLHDVRLGGVLNAQSLDLVPNPIGDMYGTDDNTLLDVIVGPAGLILSLPTVGLCMLRPNETGDQPLPPQRCERSSDCEDPRTYCSKDIRPPDVDVDGDGIELLLDLNLDGDPDVFRVDTCIDGDGTVVQDEMEWSSQACDRNRDCLNLGEDWYCGQHLGDKVCFRVTHCTQAKDEEGNYRFVDGYSILLKMEAVPVRLRGIR